MDHSQHQMTVATPGPQASPGNKVTAETARSAATTDTPADIRLTSDKTITLTAKTGYQEMAPGTVLPVWTFDNSVPGPNLRVKQGDTVRIELKNELPEPVTIHFHGVPLPNDMDGIPGVTQNAVQPGQSFTYTFKANTPGTYWYHSHQNSVNQLDRGLYGSFVVEPANEAKPDKEFTLLLDEWVSMGGDMGSGMNHSDMNMGSEMAHDMSMYDLYTINGKSGSLIKPLSVKQGDKVRIRLINAGYLSHQIDLHGHAYRIVASDGQPITNPGLIENSVIAIAPGERYDIEFTADNPGRWLIEDHSENKSAGGMKAWLVYEGHEKADGDKPNAGKQMTVVDLSQYGEAGKKAFSLDRNYTLTYTMNLNTETQNNETVYTINGKTFPNTEPLKVRKGDTVKVRLVNQSKTDDHPMHLHGHFFQVLSKNGTPLSGSPLVKDTLNLKPGEEYVVAFEADNEGNWMFHCHDLHHASAGMVTELNYEGFRPNFVPDPNAGNMPE